MARIGSTLVTNDDVKVIGQQVDELSFRFVSPLQTDNTGSRHPICSLNEGPSRPQTCTCAFDVGSVTRWQQFHRDGNIESFSRRQSTNRDRPGSTSRNAVKGHLLDVFWGLGIQFRTGKRELS